MNNMNVIMGMNNGINGNNNNNFPNFYGPVVGGGGGIGMHAALALNHLAAMAGPSPFGFSGAFDLDIDADDWIEKWCQVMQLHAQYTDAQLYALRFYVLRRLGRLGGRYPRCRFSDGGWGGGCGGFGFGLGLGLGGGMGGGRMGGGLGIGAMGGIGGFAGGMGGMGIPPFLGGQQLVIANPMCGNRGRGRWG